MQQLFFEFFPQSRKENKAVPLRTQRLRGNSFFGIWRQVNDI